VTDTYPPHEVGDVPTPVYHVVDAPSTQANTNGVANAYHPPKEAGRCQDKHKPPTLGGLAFNGPTNILGDVVEGFVAQDERLSDQCFVLHNALESFVFI
jgi:hypothetical protein